MLRLHMAFIVFSSTLSRSGFVIPESSRSFLYVGLAVIVVFEGEVSCMYNYTTLFCCLLEQKIWLFVIKQSLMSIVY